MRQYALEPPRIMSLPISSSKECFAVRRVYCVGKNYKKHVAEMGGDPKRSQPVFFTKSRETLVQSGSIIPYPPMTENLHYEAELVVALSGPSEVFGYGVGIDMTRRDLQAKAKAKGGPWDMAKSFDSCAPCSKITPKQHAPDLSHANISLTKNGEVMQNSSLDKMIWSVEEIIAHLSATITLCAGDLIFTGTPEGVGPVTSGDHIIGTITGLPNIEIRFSGG